MTVGTSLACLRRFFRCILYTVYSTSHSRIPLSPRLVRLVVVSQELLPLFGLMELGAPWSSEILPLRQRLGVWRSWLEREARTPSTSTSSTWTWPAKVLDATKKEVEVEV